MTKLHKKKLRFFDFCAWIGAGHSALHNLWWECVWFSEINEKSEKTYRLLNNADKIQNYGDLMKINADTIPDFDVAIWWFPCQSFSIVWKRKWMEDERWQIIYGITRILKEKSVKYFILENVKWLVHHDKGNTIKVIMELLDDAWYNVQWQILKSSDYWIPQIRERIYLVWIRKDLTWQILFPKKEIANKRRLSEFLINTDERYIFWEWSKGWNTFINYLSNKYNINKYNLEDLLKLEYAILDTRQSDLRIYKDDSPTLRTGRHWLLYVRDWKFRKLSGIEWLLLQWFTINQARNAIEISDTDLLSQAGNAFTVDVIEKIASLNFNN